MLKNTNWLIPTDLNIKNNNNKISIPANVVFKKKSNGINFDQVIYPPTDISVNNIENVINAVSVWSDTESLSLVWWTATISIPAPWKNQWDEVSIYYSEDNWDTWEFHANDTVELIWWQSYVEFTTTHFTDFAITLPWWTYTWTFTINNDNPSTTSSWVTLNISTTPLADFMRFSNDLISRSDREWYDTSKSWILTGTYWLKIVYAQFDFGWGDITDTHDEISYVDPNGWWNWCGWWDWIACLSLEITAVTWECRYGVNLNLWEHTQTYNAFTMTGSFTGNNWTYPLRRSCNDTAWKAPWNMQISSTDLIAGSYFIANTNIEIKTSTLKKYRWGNSFTGLIWNFTSRWVNLSTPRKIFEKTSSVGTVGEIWTDTVDLRVLIPANQEVWAYQATITIAYPQM